MKFVSYLLLLTLSMVSCMKESLKPTCETPENDSNFLVEYAQPTSSGVIYFIDPILGSESNDGLSEMTPLASLSNIDLQEISPGDQVLFKSGECHDGQYSLELRGSADSPILFSTYGSESLPILISSQETVFSFYNSEYLVLQNLSIRGGGDQAILLSNSSHIIIQGCRIGLDSHAGVVATSQYSEGSGSNFGLIQNCYLDSGRRGSTGDLQSTDGIRLMDGASDWIITNNEFRAWAHSAVSIKQIETLKKNNRNRIESNLFECGDIDYMRALDISGGDNLTANNVFYGNLIRDQSVTSHLHGNDNLVAYNLFLGCKISSASDQPWGVDFHIFTNSFGNPGRTDLVCHDNKLYNNLFYNFPEGRGVVSLNPKSNANNEVTNNEVRNNIFFNVNVALELENEPKNMVITNNIAFNLSGSEKVKWRGEDLDWKQLEDKSGLNQYLIEANLNEDPDFMNRSTEDFELNSNSPCINSAWDHNLALDYFALPMVSIPDIGPFEKQ